MREKVLFMLLGGAIGALATAIPLTRGRDAAPRERAPRIATIRDLESRVETLRRENTDLLVRLEKKTIEPAPEPAPPEELRPAEPVAIPEPPAVPTDEEVDQLYEEFGGALSGMVRGGGEAAEKARAKLHEMIARGGPALLQRIMGNFRDDSGDIGGRLVSAHMLAQSGDPDALETLKSVLRDPDGGMLDQRFASHALAFSDAPGIETFLSEVAHKVKDPGARANSAFGLARRGVDEGLKLYVELTDDAFDRGDSAAIGYLSGFFLLGEDAHEAVSERLTRYKDAQAVLLLIEVAKSTSNRKAIAALERLAYDASQPVSVQKAAQGALKVLQEDAK